MGLFQKNVAHDILVEKTAKLNELEAQANRAANLVTSTIAGLELVNQEIDDTVAEIDEYAEKLMSTRSALSKNRRHNTAIITNFSKLLQVEDAEEDQSEKTTA